MQEARVAAAVAALAPRGHHAGVLPRHLRSRNAVTCWSTCPRSYVLFSRVFYAVEKYRTLNTSAPHSQSFFVDFILARELLPVLAICGRLSLQGQDNRAPGEASGRARGPRVKWGSKRWMRRMESGQNQVSKILRVVFFIGWVFEMFLFSPKLS